MTDTELTYSLGRSAADARPRRIMERFEEFRDRVLTPAGAEKDGPYVCAPMADGHRGRGSVEAWSVVFLDLDTIASAQQFNTLVTALQVGEGWAGFGYTTSSHAPAAGKFKLRLCFALSEPVDRELYAHVARCAAAELSKIVGFDVVPDEACTRPEQPIYTTRIGAQTWTFRGDPIDVRTVAAHHPAARVATSRERVAGDAPALPSQLQRVADADPVYRQLVARGLVRRFLLDHRIAVQCPCGDEHTTEDFSDTATVYCLPHTGGFSFGTFICLHNHCRERSQESFHRALGLNPNAVRANHLGQVFDPLPDEHPEPLPLPEPPSVPTCPVDELPPVLARFVEDIADRLQAPPDYVFAAATVAIGSALGRNVCVEMKAHDSTWYELPNTWGLLIGPPSSMKSPALSEAVRPLRELQASASAVYRTGLAAYRAELTQEKKREQRALAAAAQNRGRESAYEAPASPIEPKETVYLTENATVEKLGELLTGRPALLLHRDELGSFLTDLEREENASARGFFLSGWSGRDGYRFDRIGRGTVSLDAYAVSVLGCIQPGPLARRIDGAVRGDNADGLLQRFQLAVFPSAPTGFRLVDRAPAPGVREAFGSLVKSAATMAWGYLAPACTPGRPPALKFAPDAQVEFDVWYTDFMTDRRHADASADGAADAALSAHLGKFPALVGKLAIIFHVCELSTAEQGNTPAPPRPISAQTLRRVLRVIQYLEGHARRIYAADAPVVATVARRLANRIAAGDLTDTFTARDVYRHRWRGLTDAAQVNTACALLEELDWVVDVPQDRPRTGRPPLPVYRVNPRAITKEWRLQEIAR